MTKCFTLIFLLVFFLNGYSQLPTLAGYNSDPIPSYNANEAYTLISEWSEIISPDITKPPSVREEEIFKLLVMAEGEDDPIVTYNPKMGIWKSDGLGPMIYRLKETKNLNFIKAALFKADALLARRNDTITGAILPTTGRREHTWYGNADDYGDIKLRISYLNIGGIAREIAELAHWILDNSELHTQEAPFNPTIPIDNTIGITYLDRAIYYITELKKTFDLFEEEGAYWKFNASDNVGFYFDNNYEALTKLNEYRDANSEEIPLDEFFAKKDENGWYPYPYNRVFWFCDAKLRTANALMKLDTINGTNVYSSFYDTTIDRVESVGNYLTTYAQVHNEPSPFNTNYTWPYGANQDHMEKYEDNTHVHMDFQSLIYLLDQGVFAGSHAKHIASSLYSRYFSYEHNVVFSFMDRAIRRDAILNFPIHGADPYRPRGPAFGHVIGSHATTEQIQGFFHKSVELLDESIREMQSPVKRTELLERADTRRSRWALYPFEIYELKRAYRQRVNSLGSNTNPVFTEQSPISIKQDAEAGTIVAKLEATDPDEGQTLHYWISKGNIGGRFKMNAATGEIYVNLDYPLNADLEDAYQLEVYVTDNGNPAKYDSLTMEINIEKTNSAPQVASNQHFTASRNMVNGDHVAKVVVTDAENDSIKKYMLSTDDEFFNIDPNTGIISLRNTDLKSLSSGSMRTLYVQAQDNGSPSIISDVQEVQITIKNPVLTISASDKNGEKPLKVDFSSSPIGAHELSNFEWDFDNDGIIDFTGNSASHTFTKPGVYMATVYAQDDAGLKHAERVMIRVNEGEYTQPSDLVVHYDFAGDGYTVHDISGNNHHATIKNVSNDKNIWKSGVVNGGMFFPGGSELEIPNKVFDPIVSSKSFSISFWINDGKLSFHPLFQAYDANNKNIMDISSHLYADQIIMNVNGNNFTEAVRLGLNSNVNLIRHGWTNWVFTKDASKKSLKIYINGEKKSSDWAYNYKINPAKYIRLGAISAIGKDNMSFSIDEFRIYSKALTPEEIDQLYFDISGKTNFPTSIKQINAPGNNIKVFPNPASNEVSIHLEGEEDYQSISLMDLHGKLVLKKTILNERVISLSLNDVAEGLYLLKIESNEGSSVSKLIVK